MRWSAVKDWLGRRDVRRGSVAAAVLAALLVGYALRSSEDGEPQARAVKGATIADVARLTAEAEETARERYAAGVADGRAEYAPGSAKRRRIYSTGVRAGRKAMAAKARAQYVKGVKAGRAAAGKSYSSGREDGYDVGYDDGWNDGYDASIDDSLGETSGSDDLADDRPYVGYDLDCADFSGPVAVSPGDPHDLDRDGDGIGCE